MKSIFTPHRNPPPPKSLQLTVGGSTRGPLLDQLQNAPPNSMVHKVTESTHRVAWTGPLPSQGGGGVAVANSSSGHTIGGHLNGNRRRLEVFDGGWRSTCCNNNTKKKGSIHTMRLNTQGGQQTERENHNPTENAARKADFRAGLCLRGVLWGGGGEVWDPKVCVPKMAQPDFPSCEFRCFPRQSLWSGGGGGLGAGLQLVTLQCPQ